MKNASKRIQARFYTYENGNRPVRDWIMQQSQLDKDIIGKDISRVEFQYPVGMPHCKSLGGGLWEVRSNLTQGKIARVIFTVTNNEVILLHGFIKKTQKTPEHDLNIAKQRMKEVLTW